MADKAHLLCGNGGPSIFVTFEMVYSGLLCGERASQWRWLLHYLLVMDFVGHWFKCSALWCGWHDHEREQRRQDLLYRECTAALG